MQSPPSTRFSMAPARSTDIPSDDAFSPHAPLASWYEQGVLHQQQDQWIDAIACYEKAIALQPDHAIAHYNLAVLYDQRGQLQEAIEHYQRAIALQPTYASALSNAGCVLVKLGRAEDAIGLYERAIALAPAWATPYNNLGQGLMMVGRVAEAIDSFRCAIRLEPTLRRAYVNLSLALQQRGCRQDAADALRQAIRLDPHNSSLLSYGASVFLGQGEVSAAITCLHRAIAPYGTFVEAYCRRVSQQATQANAGNGSNDAEDALDRAHQLCARFLNALSVDPSAADTQQYLAHTYAQLCRVLTTYGAWHHAERFIRQAIQVQPHRVDWYLLLGRVMTAQGRHETAVLTYHLARSLQPNSPQVALALAHAMERQQHWDMASTYYQHALQHCTPEVAEHILTSGVPESVPRPSSDCQASLGTLEGVFASARDWVAATAIAAQYHPARGYGQQDCRPVPRSPVPFAQPSASTSCGGVTCGTCVGKLVNWFQPVQMMRGVFRCTPSPVESAPLMVEQPPVFTVTIPQGRAWVAPQKSHWLICNAIAILTPDGYGLGDVSRDYPGMLPGCSAPPPMRHPETRTEPLPEVDFLPGRVAVLSGLSGHVYYHWMMDCLPRWDILNACGIEVETLDAVVVNSLRSPFQRETVHRLGIPEKKLIESDRHPHIQADELVVPSFPGAFTWASPRAIDFLRNTFLPLAHGNHQILPRRIYISRAKARHRQVLNEPEVLEALSLFGIVPVDLEALCLAEQVALFAQADIIVAPHGAGLTNLTFCEPGTRVLEIFSPTYVRHEYLVIGQQRGLRHWFITGDSLDCAMIRQLMYQSPVTEDIWVNVNTLKTALAVLMEDP